MGRKRNNEILYFVYCALCVTCPCNYFISWLNIFSHCITLLMTSTSTSFPSPFPLSLSSHSSSSPSLSSSFFLFSRFSLLLFSLPFLPLPLLSFSPFPSSLIPLPLSLPLCVPSSFIPLPLPVFVPSSLIPIPLFLPLPLFVPSSLFLFLFLHSSPQVLAADVAKERPLIVTISADSTARLWNYDNLKCEIVHSFRSDEPISVAIHSSGNQVI